MNIFLIAVLIILAAATLWGYWRGFVRIAFSLVALILTIVLVSWATPHITAYLKEHTTIYENLAQSCAEKIQDTAEKGIEDKIGETTGAGDSENISEGVGTENSENIWSGTGGQGKESGIKLEDIPLPEVWAKQLIEELGTGVSENMEKSGVYRKVGEYIADWIIRGVAFFVALIVVAILLKVVVGLLDIIAKLPVLKGVNRLLGAVAGLAQGLLMVWLILFAVAMTCTSQFGMSMLKDINDSQFLTFLYEHNGIIYFINYMFVS